ncbi:MAG: DUF469 family protein [Sandaracinaceae bacterium]|nr:DUF469 family protein [Sandaracinaceae bacterium]
MRKRLRKKLHVGEFQRTYCQLSCGFAIPSDAAFASALDAVTDLCEARGLAAGGGAGPVHGLTLVIDARKGNVTEADRVALLACLHDLETVDAVARLIDEGSLLAEL